MKRMFLVFSHSLTAEQEEDARSVLGCGVTVPLPEELQVKWSSVDPLPDDITGEAEGIVSWLSENSSGEDYILVEGDFGMAFMVVDWCLANGRIPVYSTTERIYKNIDEGDGSVTNIHQFRHVKFRRYMKGKSRNR